MLDFDMTFVIVIGLIAALIGVVNVVAKKIGNVIRVGGEEDRPDPIPTDFDPPEHLFEQGGDL